MNGMRKLLFTGILVALIGVCCACGAEPADPAAGTPSGTRATETTATAADSIDPASLQDVSVVTGLQPPETIAYLKDGKRTAFAQGGEEYARILELNNQRYSQPLQSTLGMLSPDYATQGAYLVYEYPDRAPVYFHLASSSDGSANTVVQVAEGERDKLTEEQRGWLFAFGHLAPADELLDDLETAAG